PPRRKPKGSAPACRASRAARAARQSRWRRAAPTPPACESRGWPASRSRRRGGRASFVNQPTGDAGVGVDAAVAQERPVPPHGLLVLAVAGDDQRLLVGARGLGQDDAERIGDEAAAPELDPLARRA